MKIARKGHDGRQVHNAMSLGYLGSFTISFRSDKRLRNSGMERDELRRKQTKNNHACVCISDSRRRPSP